MTRERRADIKVDPSGDHVRNGLRTRAERNPRHADASKFERAARKGDRQGFASDVVPTIRVSVTKPQAGSNRWTW